MASCPYCGTPLPVDSSGARVFCTRCGEAVPERVLRTAATEVTSEPATETLPPSTPPAPPRNIYRTAGIVVGLMAVMAAVGLIFALNTVSTRRAHDSRPGPVNAPPQPVLVAADELAALGYLPANTNLVVGLDLAAARHDPLGEQLLARLTGKDGQPAVIDPVRWTGLDADDIDHVVLGVSMTEKTTRLVLVLHTRRPYDPEKLRERLKATRSVDSAGKKVYPFHPDKLAFGAPALWSPSDTMLVVGFTHFDLDAVPDRPAANADALAAPVRQLLHNYVGVGSCAWVAGDGELLGTLLPFAAPTADLKVFAGVRTFGIWRKRAPYLDVRGSFQCRDADAARLLEEKGGQLKPLIAPLLQRFQATPEGTKLADALTESFTHDREGSVVGVSVYVDGSIVQQALGPKAAP
jgi:hypothetical protein